jgi:hypothetical protein
MSQATDTSSTQRKIMLNLEVRSAETQNIVCQDILVWREREIKDQREEAGKEGIC